MRHPACLLLLGALLLPACSMLAAEKPPVSDSLMVQVLLDLHLLEARLAVDPAGTGATRDSVLDRHGLDPATYMEAVHYYAERPEAYSQLYGQVVDGLHDRRTREAYREEP